MPRWPQRSRKIRSVSPSRVPPDQSGTVSPAATSARSGSRGAHRAGDVGEPGADGERLDHAALRPQRDGEPVREPQQRVGVPAHRTGHVDQQHHAARLAARAAASSISRRLAHPAQAGAQGAVTRRPGRGASAGAGRYAAAAGAAAGSRTCAASRCFSAADIEATSRCRSTSVSLAMARTDSGRRSSLARRRRPRSAGSSENVGTPLGSAGRGRGSPSRALKNASNTWS